MVSICVSQITNEFGHLFIFLLAFWITFFINHLSITHYYIEGLFFSLDDLQRFLVSLREAPSQTARASLCCCSTSSGAKEPI